MKFKIKKLKFKEVVKVKLTSHALKRINQRKISDEMLELALKIGCVIYNGGAKFVFVRRKDIPEDLPRSIAEKIEGIVIVMNPIDGTIVTVYKNKSGLKDIKRKIKRYERADGRSPRRNYKLSEVF